MKTDPWQSWLAWPFGVVLWLVLCLDELRAEPSAQRLQLHRAQVPQIQLSATQRQRLEALSPLRVGVWRNDLEPLESTTERHRYQGISADLLALVQGLLGTEFALVGYASRQEVWQALRDGEVDIVTTAGAAERAVAQITFSRPYLPDRSVAVLRRADGPVGIRDGARIVVLEGQGRMSEVVMAYPGSPVTLARDLASALDEVSRGSADVFMGNQLIVHSHLAQRPDHPWQVVALPHIEDAAFAFATRSSDQDLAQLLDLALEALDPLQYRAILARWTAGLGADSVAPPLRLSQAQRDWITAHPRVQVMAPHYLPYSGQDDHGNWQGLSFDVLQRISSLTGLQFDYIQGRSLSEILLALKEGSADMAVSLTQGREREFLLFSHGFGRRHWVLVENAGRPAVPSLEALSGQIVVLPDGHVLTPFLRDRYPEIRLVEVQTLEQARDWVRQGKAAATVDTEPAALRMLASQMQPHALRLGRRIEGEGASDRFAVSTRHPMLVSILDAALEALPVEEVRASRVKWLGAPKLPAAVWQRVPPWVYWAGGATLLVAAVMAAWGASLRWQIVRRQRLQQQLFAATQAAEEANAAKSRFLATVSHDMRTPLSAIVGLLELEQAQAGQTLSWALATALQSARELIDLIGDTLDLSRIEAGKLDLTVEPQPLRPFLEQVMQLFAGLAAQRQLVMSLRMEPNAEEVFLFDPLRLRQVLHNLLGNALKFTRAGSVTLEVQWHAQGDRHGTLHLNVIDTGVGLDPRQQETLFVAYVQEDASAAANARGAGLGLSICKQLVELMAGDISVQSRPGRGTEVLVRLPLERGTMPLLPNAPDHGALRVLVVDDVAIQRSVLARQLCHLGCEVVAVDSGEAALQALADETFEVLISDCRMPSMDGFALTRRVRSLETAQQRAPMTVLGCSAYCDLEDERRAEQAGMNRILPKPLPLEALQKLTEPGLDRSRLQQLAQGEPGLLRRLEDELAADLSRELNALLHLDTDDVAALRNSCHRLQGIACLIDAVPLAKACAQPGGSPADHAARMRLAVEQLLLELARNTVGNAPQFFGKFPISAP